MSNRRRHTADRHVALRDHVQEATRRLLLLIGILLTASSMVYVYRSTIIPIILSPVEQAFGDQKLMYLNPAGGFNFIFFISIYIGAAVTAPFVIQQLYAFIHPALPRRAQQLSVKLLLSSFTLLIAGVLFGYFIAVPGALTFLGEFAGEYVSAALTADSYLHFLMAYTLGLGLLFQLPLIIIIWHYIRPFTPGGLMNSERWAIVLTFIAAAIITPTPDPVNLLIVAVPIITIYQIGVVVVLLSIFKEWRHSKKKKIAVTKPTIETTPIITKIEAERRSVENVKPTEQKVVKQKSMDGFIIKQRVAPQMTIPSRSYPVKITATDTPSRSINYHSRRYIDGVSPINV